MRDFTFSVVAFAASIAILPVAAPPAHAITICTVATLTGNYGEMPTATLGTSGFSLVRSGIISFDGAGNLVGSETQVTNGGVVDAFRLKGSYKVEPYCTVTIVMRYHQKDTLINIETYRGSIVSSGTKIYTVETEIKGGGLGAQPMALESVQ